MTTGRINQVAFVNHGKAPNHLTYDRLSNNAHIIANARQTRTHTPLLGLQERTRITAYRKNMNARDPPALGKHERTHSPGARQKPRSGVLTFMKPRSGTLTFMQNQSAHALIQVNPAQALSSMQTRQKKQLGHLCKTRRKQEGTRS